MAIDYIFEGSPPPGVPSNPALGVDKTTGTLYVAANNAWNVTGSGGGGTTINPTNNVLPKRSSATAFADSGLSDNGTSITTSEAFTVNGTPVSSTFNGTTISSLDNAYYTNTVTSGSFAGFNQGTSVNPSGASSASSRAILLTVNTPSANAQNISGLVNGINANIFHNGSGALNKATRSLTGVVTDVEIAGAGSATDVRGQDSIVRNGSSGSATTAAVTAFRGVSGMSANGGDCNYYS